MRRAFMMSACSVIVLAYFFIFGSGSVQASNGPAHSETLIAGPYVIDVNLSQDPPLTDQPFEVTVIPHDRSVRLSGLVVAQPGLGTDATDLQTRLTPATGTRGAVSGWLHIPVRGAWQLVFHLNGTQGQSSGNLAVTVAAPGAIPTWLAWLIAATPLTIIAGWIYQQRRYRSKLLLTEQGL